MQPTSSSSSATSSLRPQPPRQALAESPTRSSILLFRHRRKSAGWKILGVCHQIFFPDVHGTEKVARQRVCHDQSILYTVDRGRNRINGADRAEEGKRAKYFVQAIKSLIGSDVSPSFRWSIQDIMQSKASI